jgi:hypothetical protein
MQHLRYLLAATVAVGASPISLVAAVLAVSLSPALADGPAKTCPEAQYNMRVLTIQEHTNFLNMQTASLNNGSRDISQQQMDTHLREFGSKWQAAYADFKRTCKRGTSVTIPRDQGAFIKEACDFKKSMLQDVEDVTCVVK